MDERDIERVIEAVLFGAGKPLSLSEISEHLPHVDAGVIESSLQKLQGDYQSRGIHLMNVAGKFEFMTASDIAPFLTITKTVNRKLSRAAIETLAIVAYHQPVTRGEIEDIRGVAISKGTLDTLMEQQWIQPVGRKEVPGRPLTWGTTETFLRDFTLNSLEDLPGIEDLKSSGLLDKSLSLFSLTEESGMASSNDNASEQAA